jgi:small conductance mechanosensitive channel
MVLGKGVKNMSLAQVFLASIQQLLFQLINFIPKLLVALIIWVVGKYLIGLGVDLIKKIHIKGATPVNKVVESLAYILMPFGKVLLFLIVMDYLGIGRTVIQSLLSGLTFAIAIALGISFGKALEGDAKKVVDEVKKQLEK